MNALGRRCRLAVVGVWRFLVGDTPEFLAAVAAVAGVALLLHRFHPAEWVVLPGIVLLVLAGSVWRRARVSGRMARESRTRAPDR